MAKNTSVFVCSECGATSPKWIGRCPSCFKFNTYVEEITKAEPSKTYFSTRNTSQKPKPLSEISYDKFVRTSSRIDEFDTVLGGGIVPGSLILIGGDPGIGKSTLLTQTAAYLSKNNKVLYFSAEESCSQVKLRTERLGVDGSNMYLVNENCLDDIENITDGFNIVIIDSIQAVYISELSSAAGSVGQIKECSAKLMRLAKSKNITFFIVGHVTKEGAIAGPKILEHIMDTVLYFEGENENNYKLLRAVKNRFGSSMEVGVFEMTDKGIKGIKDYSGIFISDTENKNSGCVITPSISGNRCVAVEIQSLLSKTIYGMPRRMPLGIDYNKLVLMLAVLEKKCGLPFYGFDVYINAMGGIKLSEPSIDLALIVALASSHKDIAINKSLAVFGEVGLTGEVRSVNFAEKRIQECIKLGIKTIIMPFKNLKGLEKYKEKINLVGVNHCYKAIKYLTEKA